MFAYCNNSPVLFYDPDGRYSHVYDDKTDDEALDGIVDAGGGGGGFANAYNSIDAGYSYHTDFSIAANSSLYYGGIYSCGIGTYSTTTHPDSSKFSDTHKRHTPDQQALISLANECRHCTLSQKNAETLVGWAEEYEISNHGPMKHENRRGYWSNVLHIKIYNVHIRVQE